MPNPHTIMKRCLELAKLGQSKVAPNPMVGCVIVDSKGIIAEGYHQKFGEAHAEVNAINALNDDVQSSEIEVFVNLEPCSHYGKTPPCADRLVELKPKKVWIADKDPNPLVSGSGIKRIRDAGIEVEVGLMKDDAVELNHAFYTYHRKRRPFVTLKWAQSKDGYIGQLGKQIWLTGKESRVLAHKWRSEHMAILVGSKTIRTDDPQLNTRLWDGPSPLRIVIDPDLSLDGSKAQVLTDKEPCLWVNTQSALVFGNLEQVLLNKEKPLLPQLMSELYNRNIQSVLVEGGAETIGYFLDSGIWDEALVLTAPKMLKEGLTAPKMHANPVEERLVGDDTLTRYKNPKA
jgi:diaminohydroxyphosphoribosylaminopyrimidine deaminase/5-amino-6-(5-phosphoribosylamino)uracil reductase